MFPLRFCFVPWFPFLRSEHEAGRDGMEEDVVVWSLHSNANPLQALNHYFLSILVISDMTGSLVL